MTEAEVMTTFIVAHSDFYGNFEKARTFLAEHRYVPRMIGKSQFCRRIHRWSREIWQELIKFAALKGAIFGLPNEFIIDSFPARVCQSIRMHRSRLFPSTEFKGYNACRHEYFRGLKIHAIVTTAGRPWIVWATPGSRHDLRAYKERAPWIEMRQGSTTYGDAAYLDEALENLLEMRGQKLVAARRENTRRPLGIQDLMSLQGLRRIVETTFSRVASLMPRKIHAITEKGFEMKAMGFVVAVSMIFAIN